MNLRKQVEYDETNQASVFGSCASGCLASLGKAMRTILLDVKEPTHRSLQSRARSSRCCGWLSCLTGGEEGVLRDHSNWLALLKCPCQNLAQLIKSDKFTWNAGRLQIHVNRNSSSCFCLSLSHGHIKWLFDPPQMAMDGTYTYLQFVTFAADCKS